MRAAVVSSTFHSKVEQRGRSGHADDTAVIVLESNEEPNEQRGEYGGYDGVRMRSPSADVRAVKKNTATYRRQDLDATWGDEP